MAITFEKLFDDPTENRIVNNRMFNGIFPIIAASELNDAEKNKLLHLLTLICKKLIGIRGHIDRYARNVESESNRVLNPKEAKGAVNLSDDLFLEFDGFLVQVKSSLDYLVKAPTYIVGKKYWSLHTFGDKGAKVTSALGNLPKELKQRAKGFNALLIDRNQEWLTDTIEARDKINHFLDGGIDFRLFCVRANDAGILLVPLWAPDQSIAQFMESVWANLFRFCENFLAVFLSLKLPDKVAVVHDADNFPDPTSPWKLVMKEAFEKMLQEKGYETAPYRVQP